MSIGQVRELNPCPSNGKINFQQIGAIREIAAGISMDDARLLPCRKMVGKTKEEGGAELDEYGNRVYVHSDATNDPADYYDALWAHDANILFSSENNQQINELGKWYTENEFSSDREAEEDSYVPPVQETSTLPDPDDGSVRCIRLAAQSAQIRQGLDAWSFISVDATLKNYVGKLPAGESFTIYCEWKQLSNNFWDLSPTMRVCGWADGYKGSEEYELLLDLSHEGTSWRSSKHTFVVPDNGFDNIWLEFQQRSSDERGAPSISLMKNVQIWRA